MVQNLISLNLRHGIIVRSSNVRLENNTISSNHSWGVVITLKSNLEMKLNNINDNKCGGVRIILNDCGVVTLESNVMRNRGSSVFPVESPPLLEQQLMECGSSNDFDSDNFRRNVDYFVHPLRLMDMDLTNLSFNPPRLIENVTANLNDLVELKEKTWLPELCCFCYSRLNENPFKCERCLLSRYCGEQCYLKDEEHCKICRALLSIYTVELKISPETNFTKSCGKTVVVRQRFDRSDCRLKWLDSCGVVQFSSMFTNISQTQLLLLYCFQDLFGFLEPSTMLHVKDSFVHARLEDDGKICRVFLHEPAPAFHSP